jgi:Kef-type K+ transport system membrane component KefB
VVLLSAVTTEVLGLHLLFSSFLAGAIMPKDSKFVRHIPDQFKTPIVVLLLPLYLATKKKPWLTSPPDRLG